MTVAATKAPKILEAIAAIQATIKNVPKNGEMSFGNTKYKFVKNDDILDAVQAQLIENNVIVKPELLEFRDESRKIADNRYLPIVVVKLRQTYISVDDGSEHVVEVYGEGAGTDDKGLRKAVTQAQKIANLLTFSISTGEPDPDAFYGENKTPSEATPTKAETAITKAKVSKPAAKVEGGDPIPGLRAQVKAAAGKRGLTNAELNQKGVAINADYFNDEKSLRSLLAELA